MEIFGKRLAAAFAVQSERKTTMMIHKTHAIRTLVVVAGLTLSGATMAAEISNISGQSCGSATGEWHFVNNQVPRNSGIGTLTATWSSGASCTVPASATTRSVQHFYCTASGELLSASTNLGGRLVLSDFSCETKCEIDPKTKECVVPPKDGGK
jgi:hypothetical protein